jgi:type II secretory pathway pseudopilin PulG
MKKAFSLVEILVSISIIIVLSTVGLQTFYISQLESRLDESISQVVMAIRKSQNSALAPSKSETGVSDDDKLCSFGIRIVKSTNIIRNFYTIKENNDLCGSKIFYGKSTKLQYISINETNDIDFEFNIPFATTGSQLVRLKLNDLEKTVQLTDSGLIKVE